MNYSRPICAAAPLITPSATTFQFLRQPIRTSTRVSRTTILGIQHQSTLATIATRVAPTQVFSSPKNAAPAHKEFFPKVETPAIKASPAAWHHPIYTAEQMMAVQYSHRQSRTWSDRVALTAVRVLRWSLDKAMGYHHGHGFVMTEKKYMVRNIFLESVAGVPGMVAGMLRHLHSMRRMKRDNGWMETLLEESYNERMHLLTFLKMAEPGWFMRIMVLATQGIFFNSFFIAYLISPRTCHRFVGYLEEEAVLTYTRELEDLDAGHLPGWAKAQAPDMAVAYWNMPEGKRSVRDLLMYIRADESKHREVNHTLANLDQRNDPNPYVSVYKDPHRPRPSKGIEHQKPQGWEREEVIGSRHEEIP